MKLWLTIFMSVIYNIVFLWGAGNSKNSFRVCRDVPDRKGIASNSNLFYEKQLIQVQKLTLSSSSIRRAESSISSFSTRKASKTNTIIWKLPSIGKVLVCYTHDRYLRKKKVLNTKWKQILRWINQKQSYVLNDIRVDAHTTKELKHRKTSFATRKKKIHENM